MDPAYLVEHPPDRYRRRIALTPGPTSIRGELEDQEHHFVVVLRHDGRRVTGVDVSSPRSPWLTCLTGAQGLTQLVGSELRTAPADLPWRRDPAGHCVHAADLAGLALRHARDLVPLVYTIDVEHPTRARRHARAERDGLELATWELDGATIVGPPTWSGAVLDGSFRAWCEEHLDADQLEIAFVLRRACYIAFGAGLDLDRAAVAADVHPPDGTCHTFQATVAFGARRRHGSTQVMTQIAEAGARARMASDAASPPGTTAITGVTPWST